MYDAIHLHPRAAAHRTAPHRTTPHIYTNIYICVANIEIKFYVGVIIFSRKNKIKLEDSMKNRPLENKVTKNAIISKNYQ